MRTNTKKIFAVLLTVALVATMFVMPAGATKDYTDMLNDVVINGDFEASVVGTRPYGWKFLPGENGGLLAKGSTELVANPNRWYLDGSWNFETAVVDGNKVAKMQKIGAGYYYMASQPVTVTGGKEYNISFDYKMIEAIAASGKLFTDTWAGIALSIRQYDANGNLLYQNGEIYDETTPGTNNRQINIGTSAEPVYAALPADRYVQVLNNRQTTNALAKDVMEDFSRYTHTVTLAANTTSIEVYLGFGAWNMNAKATILFDNVVVHETDDYIGAQNTHSYDLYNGSFDDFTYLADGGREAGVKGPAGWGNYSVAQNQSSMTTNSHKNNYMATIGTETDAETGKVNNFLKFELKDSVKPSGNVKGYAAVVSEPFHALASTQFIISFKYKSYGENRPTNSITLRAYFFDATGAMLSSSGQDMGKEVVSEWTDYSVTVTAPTNAVTARLALYHGTHTASYEVDAVACLDDVKIEYTGRAVQNAIDGYYEQSIAVNDSQPYAYNKYNRYYDMELVQDPIRGEVIKVFGSDFSRNSNDYKCEGYVGFWNKQLIPVTGGRQLKVSFDSYKTGFTAAATAYPSVTFNGNVQGSQIRVRYLDAEGNYILNSSGIIDTYTIRANNTLADDADWIVNTDSLTIPANAAYAEYALCAFMGSQQGTAYIEHYFDNINISVDNIPYVANGEYINAAVGTDVFEGIILGNGNSLVVADDDVATLANLVKMNNAISTTTSLPYASSDAVAVYDMDCDGRITSGDITLFRWKLLGITDESKAVK